MNWIKVRKSLLKDGRVRIVAAKCNASTVTVLGALVTLWALGDDYADADGMLLGWTAADMDREVGLPGFCESLPADWIDLGGEWLQLPAYQQHNGTTAKSRAQTQRRVAAHRHGKKGNGTVTVPVLQKPYQSREDKSRKENTSSKGVDFVAIADYAVWLRANWPGPKVSASKLPSILKDHWPAIQQCKANIEAWMQVPYMAKTSMRNFITREQYADPPPPDVQGGAAATASTHAQIDKELGNG